MFYFIKKGFTLVELMIVMAIIGILAAAMYPSITGYIARSRDTKRQTNLRDIAGAIGTYYTDTQYYPAITFSCDLSGSLAPYLGKEVKDPLVARDHGCGTNGFYGYGSGIANTIPYFSLSAYLESPASGMWNATGSNNPFTGNLSLSDIDDLKYNLIKGAGPLYVFAP